MIDEPTTLMRVVEWRAWIFVAIAAFGGTVYSYLLYPCLMWLFTFWRRHIVPSPPQDWPSVSLVIAAYNEQDVLAAKIDNSLALNYPGPVQVVVVSDGSTDSTEDIARSYEGREGYLFLEQPQNAGKTMAQNEAVKQATGDFLVFSDANSIYEPDALQRLLTPFTDPTIGCVCGELRYVNPQRGGAGQGEGFYWRYEQFLKRQESRLGSLVGANGSIYALRRELFEELDSAIISDFIMPIRIRRNGWRVVYVDNAVAVETSAPGFDDEMRRRRRIVARSVYSLWKERGALLPLWSSSVFAFELWSHKVMRWLVPVFLLILLVSTVMLALQGHRFGTPALVAQAVFYSLALLGAILPRSLGRVGLFYVPTYFCAINLGALRGMLGALRGQRHTVWKPVAR
ncbi:MAG: glycosyl transferase [Gemmatimonadetes bacterium]|nr:glycosyl transferase [Gemmatimonadota bacterium]